MALPYHSRSRKNCNDRGNFQHTPRVEQEWKKDGGSAFFAKYRHQQRAKKGMLLSLGILVCVYMTNTYFFGVDHANRELLLSAEEPSASTKARLGTPSEPAETKTTTKTKTADSEPTAIRDIYVKKPNFQLQDPKPPRAQSGILQANQQKDQQQAKPLTSSQEAIIEDVRPNKSNRTTSMEPSSGVIVKELAHSQRMTSKKMASLNATATDSNLTSTHPTLGAMAKEVTHSEKMEPKKKTSQSAAILDTNRSSVHPPLGALVKEVTQSKKMEIKKRTSQNATAMDTNRTSTHPTLGALIKEVTHSNKMELKKMTAQNAATLDTNRTSTSTHRPPGALVKEVTHSKMIETKKMAAQNATAKETTQAGSVIKEVAHSKKMETKEKKSQNATAKETTEAGSLVKEVTHSKKIKTKKRTSQGATAIKQTSDKVQQRTNDGNTLIVEDICRDRLPLQLNSTTKDRHQPFEKEWTIVMSTNYAFADFFKNWWYVSNEYKLYFLP